MRKVLLVDDESFIRKGIRTMIERSEMDFKDISECWNGIEALDQISKEKFDLVILDMRMPNMDGITFMKETQKLKYKPKFLILSGYNDFKYAAESLKYGAKAYLLKPVQRDELTDALKKVEEELRKEEEIGSNSRKVDIIIDHFRIRELNTLFLNTNLSDKQIREIIDVLEIDIFKQAYSLSLIKRLDMSLSNENDSVYLTTLIERYFEDLGMPVLAFILEDGISVIASNCEVNNEQVLRFIKENLGGEYAIGISDCTEGILNIKASFLQAKEALKYRVFATSDKIIKYSSICMLNKNYKIPLELIKKIPQMVGTNRVKELELTLNEIFNIEMLKLNNIGYLQEITESINKYVLQYFVEHIPQKAATMKKQFDEMTDIYNFRNIGEYFHTLKNSIVEINNFYMTLRDVYRKNNKIDAAIAFIEENYYKDISMTMVANYVSINYTNFSIIFSEETGMSFLDYLRQIRINKAQELIKNTEYRINEISQMVGFKNPKHFAKSFRMVMGISPKEYRNNSLAYPK